MIVYPDVYLATFLFRENRFIANCRLEHSKEVVRVHVKNTGRCTELLKENVQVSLSYQPSSTRKTAYDLIAVAKQGQWVNIDSQIPNRLASEEIQSQKIQLPGLKGNITYVKREQLYGQSKFDLYIKTSQDENVFVEVKGMTLENHQVGAFPDAPTTRGLKHVNELITAIQAGYKGYLLFIVQLETVDIATIHKQMQPELARAIAIGQKIGLQVLAYNCHVSAATIAINQGVPFSLEQPFEDPNTER